MTSRRGIYYFVILISFLLLGVIFIMTSQSLRRNQGVTLDNNIITEPGIYYVKNKKYSVHVMIDADNTFYYTVSDNRGKKLIESDKRPSIFQRWFLFWDSDDNLWVHSSDIGGVVWIKEGSIYKEYNMFERQDLIKKIPVEVYQNLPSTLIKRFKDKINKNGKS